MKFVVIFCRVVISMWVRKYWLVLVWKTWTWQNEYRINQRQTFTLNERFNCCHNVCLLVHQNMKYCFFTLLYSTHIKTVYIHAGAVWHTTKWHRHTVSYAIVNRLLFVALVINIKGYEHVGPHGCIMILVFQLPFAYAVCIVSTKSSHQLNFQQRWSTFF